MKISGVALRAFFCLVVAAAGSGAAAGRPAPEGTRAPAVLTTDCGTDMDDQWTLAQLALAPEIDLRGVVTTHAPNLPTPSAETSARCAREVLARLRLVARPPVFAGSTVALPGEPTPLPNAGVSFILEQSRQFSPARRLALLVTGAATDVASALLLDPTLADRVEVVAMGFEKWPEGGDPWNVRNDPSAWRVVLASRAPVTIGDAAVTRRDLTVTRERASDLFAARGEAGKYLFGLFEAWLNRETKLVREVTGRPDAWPVWDQVVVAHLLGLTKSEERARPALRADLSFAHAKAGAAPQAPLRWITAIDAEALWRHFVTHLERNPEGRRRPLPASFQRPSQVYK